MAAGRKMPLLAEETKNIMISVGTHTAVHRPKVRIHEYRPSTRRHMGVNSSRKMG